MRDFLIPYFLNILYEDFHVLGCMFTTTILDSEFPYTNRIMHFKLYVYA